MRILVDQSGYDLLNIGDVAMLQGCIARLRQQWPDASIMVIAHASKRLAGYCPGTLAIGPTFADHPAAARLPRRYRLGSEQVWKIAGPYLSIRPGRAGSPQGRCPRTAVEAVRAADLVVASGGGYLTDVWWWHAAGVLSLLALAQRLGKATAMFGQGIGPADRWSLRAQARSVLPGLTALGLREAVAGQELAVSLGARPERIFITGDDALELVGDGNPPLGTALGVNMRVAGYSGVGAEAAAAVGEVAVEAAAVFQAPVAALPVSRYPGDADLGAIRQLLGRAGGDGGVTMNDISTPRDLITATAGCRVVVTGSYHAAVFSVAQGIPAVCMTGSAYYDGKFGGLQALFPGMCAVVRLNEPEFPARLRSALRQAWCLPAADRAAARATAMELRTAGRQAYRTFRDTVECGPAETIARRELVR